MKNQFHIFSKVLPVMSLISSCHTIVNHSDDPNRPCSSSKLAQTVKQEHRIQNDTSADNIYNVHVVDLIEKDVDIQKEVNIIKQKNTKHVICHVRNKSMNSYYSFIRKLSTFEALEKLELVCNEKAITHIKLSSAHNIRIDSNILKTLLKVTSLKEICAGHDITDMDLNMLAKCKHLEKIDLQDSIQITEEALTEALLTNPKIKFIVNERLQPILDEQQANENIYDIDLRGVQHNQCNLERHINIDFYNRVKAKLIRCTMPSSEISINMIEPFSKIESLEKLELIHNGSTDVMIHLDFSDMKGILLKSMREAIDAKIDLLKKIGTNRIQAKVSKYSPHRIYLIVALYNVSTLESVNLIDEENHAIDKLEISMNSPCTYLKAIVEILCKIPGFKHLQLKDVQDGDVEYIAPLTNLTSLTISNHNDKITDKCVKTLIMLHNLTFIDLCNRGSITEQGARTLIKSFPHATLHLSNRNLPQERIEELRNEEQKIDIKYCY